MSSSEVAMEEETLYKFPKRSNDLYSAHELYAVAKYMDRDPDFWMFRRFGTLQLFNILSIQQRLTALEDEFQRRTSSDPSLSCDDLIPDIKHALKEYNDALAAQAKFRSYLKPEPDILKDMDRWSQNHEPALRKGLGISGKVKNYKDIAAIAAIEKTWVHRFIDRHRRLYTLFEDKTANNGMWSTLIYYEESVLRAEAILIHIGFCVLLLCPVIALLYVDSKVWKIIVLAVFLLVVSALSVTLLNTPNKTGLALVAGYAAILVVFLSNNINS